MGHALSKERNQDVHLRCDGVCGTAVVLDAWLWSCAKCDFDLCVACAHQPEDANTAGMEAADRYVSAQGGLDDVKRELWDTWGESPERVAKRAREAALGGKHRSFTKSKGQRKGGADSGADDEPKRRSPRKSAAPAEAIEDCEPTPAQLAALRPPPPYAEEALRSAPLVEPISGLPLRLEPLPELPADLEDPVLLAALRGKRAWLSSLFELEISRELRDESATPCPCPDASEEEQRRARVHVCLARFREARDDLLAAEQLQLGL